MSYYVVSKVTATHTGNVPAGSLSKRALGFFSIFGLQCLFHGSIRADHNLIIIYSSPPTNEVQHSQHKEGRLRASSRNCVGGWYSFL